MSPNKKQNIALERITKDRQRTNLFKTSEQKFIAFLVQRIPSWINSNMLTAIGLFGSVITALAFILALYIDRYFLLLGIVGFFINWFGDSLDGRLAYYRNCPRKWYGFSLDLTVDWLTNILIGFGYIVYVKNGWELVGFAFVVLYGWAMMIALLRYKITNKYSIDSGILGPTEVRIIISLFLVLEVLVPNSIHYTGVLACVILLVINLIDSYKLLKTADQLDIETREKNASSQEK